MKINAYCENKGWLFEDLKEKFREAGCFTSEEPMPDADVWICIRSREAFKTPDPTRTIVQIHDTLLPLKRDLLEQFPHFGAIVFTHPYQEWLWHSNGFRGENGSVHPIGSRTDVKHCPKTTSRPTVGFFCREVNRGPDTLLKGSDLLADVVDLARRKKDFDVLMIGGNLRHIARLGTYEERAAGVDDYNRIDCLFVGSVSPCVPLSMYEALAAGVEVISTPRWLPDGIANTRMVEMSTSKETLDKLLRAGLENPRIQSIRTHTLERWVDLHHEIAKIIANR